MHADISAFPNREIYDGKLRNGSGTDLALNVKLPGLSKTLKGIIAEFGMSNFQERRIYKLDATDADVRLHWIEVKGERVRHPATKSICVKEHVHVFFTKIFPRLLASFKLMGKRVDENLMIICAYGHTVSLCSRRRPHRRPN